MMRYLFYLTITILLFSCVNKQMPAAPVSVDLSSFWKFKTGDNISWINPAFDDSAWDSIRGSQYWESQGYDKYDGFAWYRKMIFLPSAMKRQAFHDSVIFDFGKIDDCSQIYMNGKLIDESPNFSNACNKDYAIYHKLRFHVNQLEWDKELCLAVRVCDAGGNGGFSNANLSIYPLQTTYVKISCANAKNENLAIHQPAEISIAIENLTSENIQGTLDYYILNSNSDSMAGFTKTLLLEKGMHDYALSFTPDTTGFYYITYKLTFTKEITSSLEGHVYAGMINGPLETKPYNISKIPLIYSSDLFHPHDDPDDHFDAASIAALDEFDIRGFILDEGMTLDQKKRNGIIPATQLKHITKKNFPVFIGLTGKLKSPDDKALDQPAEYQKGVECILETLEKSPVPVTLAAVGSMKDIAAAYNRNPELFRKKAGKLLLFIGDVNEPSVYEWNVRLDSCAFICLMNSDLPVYWIPCFDKKTFGMNASVWSTSHQKLLKYASPRLINFFAYMLIPKDDADIISYIESNCNSKEIERTLSDTRWLYGAGIFTYFTGRKIIKKGDDYIALPAEKITKEDTIIEPFSFVQISALADNKGVIHLSKTNQTHRIMLFRINDKDYPEIMTSVTANLLKDLR